MRRNTVRSFIFSCVFDQDAIRRHTPGRDELNLAAQVGDGTSLSPMYLALIGATAFSASSQRNGGIDPRKLKQDELDAERVARELSHSQTTAAAVKALQASVTVGSTWPAYLTERSALWSRSRTSAWCR